MSTSTKQILTQDTFETERGDRVCLPESPKKCWRIDGPDAEAANALQARWQELRDELSEAEGAFADQKRAIEKMQKDAEEKKAQALIDAAIIGGDDPKTDAKAAKAIETARQDLAATQDRCAILPRAIAQCASQWAAAASECLLGRLHATHGAADELAARIETLIPELIMEWRAFGKEQSASALGLARIAEACSGEAVAAGNIKTAELRLLCGESLSNIVSMAVQRTDPTITLRGPQRHRITAGAFRSGSLGAGY